MRRKSMLFVLIGWTTGTAVAPWNKKTQKSLDFIKRNNFVGRSEKYTLGQGWQIMSFSCPHYTT